jgi:hypothetical protein
VASSSYETSLSRQHGVVEPVAPVSSGMSTTQLNVAVETLTIGGELFYILQPSTRICEF